MRCLLFSGFILCVNLSFLRMISGGLKRRKLTFYNHELREVDLKASGMSHDATHVKTLQEQGIVSYQLYPLQ